jgi:predicted dienelactone hydrolase
MTRSNHLFVQIGVALLLGSMLAACGDDDEWRSRLPAPVPTPTATPTVPLLTSAQVMQPGPFSVGVTTMTFEDTTRPTMPNGTFPGSPTRVLVTEIWYPVAPGADAQGEGQRDAALARDGAPYPLAVYGHGLSGTRTSGAYLARHLATHGYIVAAPDFPLTRSGAPGGSNAVDVVEQPADVRFLNSQLLALDGDPASTFFAGIDQERIGVTGLSLGGLTAYMVTFHPTLRDPRVRAAAPLAGNACFLSHGFFGDTTVPLLIVQGDLDAVLPYQAHSLFAFEQANAPKWLVTIANGSHMGFGDSACPGLESMNNPDNIACLGAGGPGGNYYSAVVEGLGGPAVGLVLGDCQNCPKRGPFPRSIRPCRQHELTILSVYPFFEAILRGDQAARRFLDHTLAAENPELTVARQ